MVFVTISIGSNIEREKYINACLDAVTLEFGELLISSVYESEAVGFDGDNFYNLVVGFYTDKPVCELTRILRDIEHQNGRQRGAEKFCARTLDIDILTYNQSSGIIDGIHLPRKEITENAFVLQPLADIAGDHLHPLLNISYKEMWQAYDKSKQKLWPVDFIWQGKYISRHLAA